MKVRRCDLKEERSDRERPSLDIFSFTTTLLPKLILPLFLFFLSNTTITEAAIGTGGATCTSNSKTADTSLACTVGTENIEAGNYAIMWFAGDNLDNGGNNNLLTSVTDSQGNDWTVQRCYSSTFGAGSGATTCIASSKITTALTSTTDTITANYSSITAKAIVVKEFTVGTDNDLYFMSGFEQDVTDTTDPPALTISGLPTADHLFIRATALEQTAGGTWTPTSGYTTSGCAGTSGAGSASNMETCGEFHIVTATTSDISDPAGTGADTASTFIAFREQSTYLSGTLYTALGATTTLASKTIKLWVGTSTPGIYTTTSDGSGAYTFIVKDTAINTPMLLYVDGDTNKAANFTRLSNGAFTHNLYASSVTINNSDDTTALTIDDLALYDSSDDTDLQYTATSSTDTLTVSSGHTFYIAPDATFTSGGAAGALSFDDVVLGGSFTASSTQAISVTGSWSDTGTGNFSPANSTVTMTANSGSNTVGGNFYNLTLSGTDTFTTTADLNVLNNLDVSNGTLTGSDNTTVHGGTFDGNGTVSFTDGTNLTNVVELTAGNSHTCARTNSGGVYCWGYAAAGQLGDAQTATNRTTPVRVQDGAASGADSDGTNLTNVVELTTGNLHTCARTGSGGVYCWGRASSGQLGDNQTATDRPTPVRVHDGAATGADTDGTNLTNVVELTTGAYHTCARTNSGGVYCWGDAVFGQLGDNQTATDRPTPVRVLEGAATGADSDGTNLTNVVELTTGAYHTCARTNSGGVYCWGEATYGQLGDNQIVTDRTTPVRVHDGAATGADTDGTNLTNVVELTAGDFHTCARTNSGGVYCWGESANGRLGDNQTATNRTTPVHVYTGAATEDVSDIERPFLTLLGTGSIGNTANWETVHLVLGDAHTTGTTTLSGTGLITASGTILVKENAVASTSQDIFVAGGYVNEGTFIHNSGTTTFSGTTPQTATGTLSGTSAFNNLQITNTSANGTTSRSVAFMSPVETVSTFTMIASTSASFPAGATSTFQNVDWQGNSISPVWLRSTATGTQWYLDIPGSQLNVDYVNVKDSSASSTITASNSYDIGNNINWSFGAAATSTGTSTISNHDDTQINNAFDFQNKTDEPLFAFKLTPDLTNSSPTVTDLVITLSGVKKIEPQTSLTSVSTETITTTLSTTLLTLR